MVTLDCREEVENTTIELYFEEPEPKVTTPTITPTPTLEVDLEVEEVIPEEPQQNSDAVILAKMAWGEARGCQKIEIAAVMWVALNRVDSTGFGMGNSVEYVVSFPHQFYGYSPTYPVTDELYDLAVDVLNRWQLEKNGASAEEVGRVIPKEYLYFHGDGEQNWFRTTYKSTGEYWDWSLPNPYEESGE